jgi:hypothetical protein
MHNRIDISHLAGQHMSAVAVQDALAVYPWGCLHGLWPEVNQRGLLTGDVLDSDADVIIVDWDGRKLTTRNGHACEACIRRFNAPQRLNAEAEY